MPARRRPRTAWSCAARSFTRWSAVRASVLAGFARASFVYSTTARSKSWASSAWRPRRIPDAVAHADTLVSSTTSRSAARRSARASVDDIGPPRDLEREHAVGQPRVLAIVAELEHRPPALLIGRGQRSNLQRLRVDAEHEPVVVALLL